jgi:hypothetical protein
LNPALTENEDTVLRTAEEYGARTAAMAFAIGGILLRAVLVVAHLTRSALLIHPAGFNELPGIRYARTLDKKQTVAHPAQPSV